VRYAYYYLNCRRAAEDIAHDAILYYWERRRELAPETDVLGYILLTVRNKCLNYLKHIRLEAEHARDSMQLYEWEVRARIGALEEEHYGAIFTSEMERIVRASLSELPAQTRRIFVLNRFRNKSRKEIAAAMNVSQQKVDYHVNKATEHLYRALKDFIPAVGLLWHVFFCDEFGNFPGWVALYI
jgi:RNA polymerase sigma-70 factor (ECF subfamily)